MGACLAAACARGDALQSDGDVAAIPVRVAEVITDTIAVPTVLAPTVS